MQGFRRFLAAMSCVVVGGASFALSFVALRDVAVAVQAVPAGLGWLVPIVIDGGVICGSAVIWSLSREQARRPIFPFIFVAILVGVSVVVNAAHAGPSVLAKLIASLPPLILLGTLELVAAQGRRMAPTAAQRNVPADTPVTAPAAPAAPRPVTASVTASTPNRTVATSSLPPASQDPVSELEAAVEEVFEPVAWSKPTGEVVADGARSTQTRRRTTRVRAEQPQG